MGSKVSSVILPEIQEQHQHQQHHGGQPIYWGSDTPDRGVQGAQGETQPRVQVATDKKRVPVVEEEFVQRMAYKCGVTGEELEKKKETYLDRMAKDPTLGFEVMKEWLT